VRDSEAKKKICSYKKKVLERISLTANRDKKNHMVSVHGISTKQQENEGEFPF
jgi:hypothetical protein